MKIQKEKTKKMYNKSRNILHEKEKYHEKIRDCKRLPL